MSATEELRRLLDEHGIEYDADDTTLDDDDVSQVTYWQSNDIEWSADGRDEYLAFDAVQLITPEQAIAATLGTGTCFPALNSERDGMPYLNPWFVCSECGCQLTESRLGRIWQNYCPNCGRRIRIRRVDGE